MIREQAIEAVEQTTGRVVLAHLSDTDPGANVAAEVLVEPEDGIADGIDGTSVPEVDR